MHPRDDIGTELPASERALLQERIAELEARVARYEALIAQFPGGAILLFDHALRYTLADGTALEATGLSKATLEGRTIYEVFPPETVGAIEPLYRAALDGQRSVQEVPYADHIFEVRTQPLNGPDGGVLGGMTVSVDVSARKAAETALQEANRRISTLLEEIPDAFYRLDQDWRFSYVNQQAGRLLGSSAEALTGKNVWEEFPEAVQTNLYTNYHTARETQQVVTFELYYPPFGRWYELRAVPAGDSLSVYFHDISDTKRSELTAHDQAELFQTVIDQMSDGVILVNPDGQFRIFNRAAQRMLGADTSTSAPSVQQRLFLPDQQTPFPAEELPLVRALRGEERLGVEMFVRHAQAPEGLWISVNGRPIYGADGQLSGGLVVCRDESERKRSLAEHEALHEEIIRMQSATLRELSTPLIPINEQVMVMPLVGSVDSHRAELVMETLLDGIARNRARVAILDITGVPVVDTQVANALLRAAQSARLLGADVVLTGIRPEVAQTLVGLGVGLGGIITRSTLQSGIAYAMGRG